MKVECTRVLLAAGYSILEDIDVQNNSSYRHTTNEVTGKIESTVVHHVPVNFSEVQSLENTIITQMPEVYISFKCFSEYSGRKAQSLISDLEKGFELICNSQLHFWLAASSITAYNYFQEAFPALVPPIIDIKAHFCDFPSKYSTTESNFEVTVRACRIQSRIIFTIFRPVYFKNKRGAVRRVVTRAKSDSSSDSSTNSDTPLAPIKLQSSARARLNSSDNEM